MDNERRAAECELRKLREIERLALSVGRSEKGGTLPDLREPFGEKLVHGVEDKCVIHQEELFRIFYTFLFLDLDEPFFLSISVAPQLYC